VIIHVFILKRSRCACLTDCLQNGVTEFTNPADYATLWVLKQSQLHDMCGYQQYPSQELLI